MNTLITFRKNILTTKSKLSFLGGGNIHYQLMVLSSPGLYAGKAKVMVVPTPSDD